MARTTPIEDTTCVVVRPSSRKGSKRTRSQALPAANAVEAPLAQRRRRCNGTRSQTPSSSTRTPPKRAPQGGRSKKLRQASRGGPRRGSTEQAKAVVSAAAIPPAKLNIRDIKAVVVNLERRADRMVGCVSRMSKWCPWLQYSRFPACDGKLEKMSPAEVVTSWHTGSNVHYQKLRAIRKGWDDLDTYKERTLKLSLGEQGCAVSHIRAWERCLEQCGKEQRPLMVLEDDAAPTPEFTAKLEAALAAVPSDVHVLYLGYSQAADWPRVVSQDVVESEYVWTTVGYIVWPAGARVMLSKLPVDGPVDNWMAGLNASGDLKSYCVRPKIVLQADAWNVNSDVAHSDEHYWGPDSDIRHSDEFYWGPEPEHRPSDSADAPEGEQAAPGAGRSMSGSLFWDMDSASDDSADEY